MKQVLLITLISLFSSHYALAEIELNTSNPLDSIVCSNDTELNDYLNQSTDLVGIVSILMSTCPEKSLQIASLATNLNPQLAREIYTVLFQNVPAEQLVQRAVDAVRSVEQEQRADVVQAAIENAPQALAQAIVDAIADAGLMDPTEIIIAAIAGGADPSSITEPSAAGIATPPPVALAPGNTNTFGTGNGNNGGTASPN
ncbi:hypothetical protein FXE63_19595 [Vibrio mimicus]|uniref:hypothetical protein n=1 Tax=Vibrio mimicus TaxID=674 RepID=UPI0011DAA4E5|nr:hypothetical protein [Vibrio mimicus]TXZ06019.1 hypothetical protein FXE63_19595 [Vibrio mimicus]